MTDDALSHRYRHRDGKVLIEVRIKTAQQLFDARDPAPFRDRDLDDDFVEYVESAALEASRNTPLKIVISIEEGETKELPRDSIREAIHVFFQYRVERQARELKTFLRRAEMFLGIGVLFLGTCLAVAQNIANSNATGVLGILREGIVIFGWVSIWKPLEFILFDWYPHYEKLRFNRKLLASEIDVQFPAKT